MVNYSGNILFILLLSNISLLNLLKFLTFTGVEQNNYFEEIIHLFCLLWVFNKNYKNNKMLFLFTVCVSKATQKL